MANAPKAALRLSSEPPGDQGGDFARSLLLDKLG